MAHVAYHAPSTNSFTNRGGLFSRLSGRWAAYRRYRETLAELEALSENELDDIGVSRFDLKAIAWESAYSR